MGAEVRLRSSRTPYRRAGLVLSGSPLVMALVELTGGQLVRLVRDPTVQVELRTGEDADWEKAPVLSPDDDDAKLAAFIDENNARERELLGKVPDPAATVLPKRAAGKLAADAPASAAPSTDAPAPADDTNTQRENPAATEASAPAGGAPAPSTGTGDGVDAAAGGAGDGGSATQPAPAEAKQPEATATPPVVEPKPAAKRKGSAKTPRKAS